jgi:hypothetical protein
VTRSWPPLLQQQQEGLFLNLLLLPVLLRSCWLLAEVQPYPVIACCWGVLQPRWWHLVPTEGWPRRPVHLWQVLHCLLPHCCWR